MSARCGSRNPDHRASNCLSCNRIYKRRSKDGRPRFNSVWMADPAVCVFCGLAAGNSMDIKVIKYPLRRRKRVNGKETTVYIGSLGMCDRCLLDHADIKPEYLKQQMTRNSQVPLGLTEGDAA